MKFGKIVIMVLGFIALWTGLLIFGFQLVAAVFQVSADSARQGQSPKPGGNILIPLVIAAVCIIAAVLLFRIVSRRKEAGIPAIGLRGFAFLLDIVPIWGAVTLVYWLFFDLESAFKNYYYPMEQIALNDESFYSLALQIRGITEVAYLLYSTIADCSPLRGTLGKKVLGIRVVSDSGKQLTFFASCIRNLGRLVSIFPFGFGYAWALSSEYRQTWHDRWAKSLVEEIHVGQSLGAHGHAKTERRKVAGISLSFLAVLGCVVGIGLLIGLVLYSAKFFEPELGAYKSTKPTKPIVSKTFAYKRDTFSQGKVGDYVKRHGGLVIAYSKSNSQLLEILNHEFEHAELQKYLREKQIRVLFAPMQDDQGEWNRVVGDMLDLNGETDLPAIIYFRGLPIKPFRFDQYPSAEFILEFLEESRNAG